MEGLGDNPGSVVLETAKRLLNDCQFHDSQFLCDDGVVVSTNKAFVTASNAVFNRLLCGGFAETGSACVRLQAASEPLQAILHYLHTGQLPSNVLGSGDGSGACWPSLAMATACLGQQYMIPTVVSVIADSVKTDLSPQHYGLVLSQALEADLQPVIKNLWLAASRLLPQPLAFDSCYSADAVAFCLQHTAWMKSSSSSSSSSGTAAAANGTSAFAVATTGSDSPSTPAAASDCFGQETAAFNAVLDWFLACVEDCPDCHHSQHSSIEGTSIPAGCASSNRAHHHPATTIGSSSMPVPIPSKPPVVPKQQQQHQQQRRLVEPSDSCSSLQLPGSSHHQRHQHRALCINRCGSACTTASNDITTDQAGSSSSSGSGSIALSPASSVDAALAARSSGDDSSDSECCGLHQRVLLQLLGRLSWPLLQPAAMDRLESLGLLSERSLLALYRAQQRCSHLALQGCFTSISLPAGGGLRCFTWGGEQILECDSPSHVTASASLPITSGRVAWQVVCQRLCDLTWVGLTDGSVAADSWGGKQDGAWLYGSNDAVVCAARQSGSHAYATQCGFGVWRDGAGAAAGGDAAAGAAEVTVVVDVLVDMEAREVWFSVDGADPRLGFSGLPARVYPAVSVRSPARLAVRFRQQGCGLVAAAFE